MVISAQTAPSGSVLSLLFWFSVLCLLHLYCIVYYVSAVTTSKKQEDFQLHGACSVCGAEFPRQKRDREFKMCVDYLARGCSMDKECGGQGIRSLCKQWGLSGGERAKEDWAAHESR